MTILVDDRIARFKGKGGRVKGQCLGVYSCMTNLANLDKRSREYRLMRKVRQDLTKHIGGKPNLIQRMLIDRAAILSLRIAMLDQKIVDGAIMGLHENNQYLAWSNSLVRTLARLGVDEPDPAPASPALNDVLADIAARRRPQPEDADADDAVADADAGDAGDADDADADADDDEEEAA